MIKKVPLPNMIGNHWVKQNQISSQQNLPEPYYISMPCKSLRHVFRMQGVQICKLF